MEISHHNMQLIIEPKQAMWLKYELLTINCDSTRQRTSKVANHNMKLFMTLCLIQFTIIIGKNEGLTSSLKTQITWWQNTRKVWLIFCQETWWKKRTPMGRICGPGLFLIINISNKNGWLISPWLSVTCQKQIYSLPGRRHFQNSSQFTEDLLKWESLLCS